MKVTLAQASTLIRNVGTSNTLLLRGQRIALQLPVKEKQELLPQGPRLLRGLVQRLHMRVPMPIGPGLQVIALRRQGLHACQQSVVALLDRAQGHIGLRLDQQGCETKGCRGRSKNVRAHEKSHCRMDSGLLLATAARGRLRQRTQPPLCERLPGFFLLRVATPRSRLMR